MAALNDKHSGTYCPGAIQRDWMARAKSGGWIFNEHVFAIDAISNTSCIVLLKGPSWGYRIADWFVVCQQIDTDAAPELVLNIGKLNSTTTPTGLSTTWLSTTSLGRAAGTTMVRNTDGACSLDRFLSGSDIGVHVGTVAKTPAHNSQRIGMGFLLVPW